MGAYPLIKRPTPLKDIVFGDTYRKFVEGKVVEEKADDIKKTITTKLVNGTDGTLFKAFAKNRLLRGNK